MSDRSTPAPHRRTPRPILRTRRPTPQAQELGSIETRQAADRLDAVRRDLPAPADPAVAWAAESVTARLGILAGAALANVPLGTAGPALEQRLPILFPVAAELGVRIETVSVGQGFFDADGELLSERDLDLVVTGPRVDVNALGAILGRAWNQASVFIWYADAGGTMGTATIPLPGGTEMLRPEICRGLAAALPDGGHVRCAGPDSLLFVANIGREADAAFAARMRRVHRLLERADVRAGPVRHDRAAMVTLDRERYDEYLDRGGVGRAA